MKKLGIVCPRGGGDIVIVLPIAKWYHDLNYEIHWVIDEMFKSAFQKMCPWINFIGITPDENQGPLYGNIFNSYWCEEPRRILKELKCEQIFTFIYEDIKYRIPGTESRINDDPLSIRAYHLRLPYFKRFDEYRYAYANIPLMQKWKLSECINRDLESEQTLYNKIVDKNKKQVVFNLTGGTDGGLKLDIDRVQFLKSINLNPDEIQCIDIEKLSDNPFDWLSLIEKSEAFVCIDSMFANIVDQLLVPVDKYFIRRSPWDATPVLGSNWNYLPIELPTDAEIQQRQYADRRPKEN
jgi:hypothetical protein